MNIQSIKQHLNESSIFHSENLFLDKPSVIGYSKEFRWSWIATQLNTFIVATDFGEEKLTQSIIELHLTESFKYAKQNYNGWPKGLQSGLGVISILISKNVEEGAKEYCRKLKSGKKWAGFSIPVIYNPETNKTYQFEKNPIWGRIYYPHFRKLINSLK
jgi:hypothetical protein